MLCAMRGWYGSCRSPSTGDDGDADAEEPPLDEIDEPLDDGSDDGAAKVSERGFNGSASALASSGRCCCC